MSFRGLGRWLEDWEVKPHPLRIQFGARMPDEEIQKVFAVDERQDWFRAVIQIIDEMRQESADLVPSHIRNPLLSDKTLAVGSAAGAYEVLSNLIKSLNKERTDAVKAITK